ncbi:hypothetical protein BKA81DRAFT_350155 [Phyllosticta paracitricarpa]
MLVPVLPFCGAGSGDSVSLLALAFPTCPRMGFKSYDTQAFASRLCSRTPTGNTHDHLRHSGWIVQIHIQPCSSNALPWSSMEVVKAFNRNTYPHSPFRPCQRISNHSLSIMSELSTRPREGSRTLDRHTHIAEPGYLHPLIAAAPGHSWPLFS